MPLIDPLLLATCRLSTFIGNSGLTNASGFLFRRDERLYLVSSRHVFIDEAMEHRPDRLEMELHLDADIPGRTTGMSALLYRNGRAVWRQGRDKESEIDVAVLGIDLDALPPGVVIRAFSPRHLATEKDNVTLGQPILIPGFPLGFHDAVHHLPVVRHAIVASPWGLRFQGQGFFLTDARTHRGTSGAPVAARAVAADLVGDELPWKLLGIHSSRMDMGNRDPLQDESLGLNISWYPDILLTLTERA
jgi:S1-C subfamily serine protease